MLYKLRTGDIILCNNKSLQQTNAYLVVYDSNNGYGLWCLTCGEALGFYGDDIEKMKNDILDKEFLDVQAIVPKETMSNFFNNNYKLEYPVRNHDGFNDGTNKLNIIIEKD